MPRISVTERDLSWYFRQRGQGVATVYIPGIATFGPQTPVLCDSTNFANVFGTDPVDIPDELSYLTATSFIKSGFNVLFHRFVPESATTAKCDYTTNENSVIISAKYPGSFGNKITLEIKMIDSTKKTFTIFVYLAGKTLVETLTVSLLDAQSDKYYTFFQSDYIKIEIKGDASAVEITDGDKTLTGGTDYSSEKTSSEVLEEIATAVSTSGALADLEDPYQYGFDIITSAGLPRYKRKTLEEPAPVDKIDPVDEALASLAEKRGTAVYLVDGGRDWDSVDLYTYAGLFNSSYAAVFGPWGYAQYVSRGTTALLPGSYAMIIAWAQSCSAGNPLWMAPAGVKRASLGSFYKETRYPVGKSVLDSWQSHDYVKPNSYSINPIMKVKQYGYVVYGNSTLLHTRNDGATSMLQSFSTRVLANLIKGRAFEVSLSLQFDQLSSDLFTQFKSTLGVYMDQLRYQNALYDYEIVLESEVLTSADLNEKKLPVIIRISPNPAAENFDISLEITQSGVSFTDDTDETEID